MSTLIKQAIAVVEPRRTFLSQAGLLLSGTAIALLSGREALAAKGDQAVESDLRILNTALGAELEAIAAYQVGAESGPIKGCGQRLSGRRAGSVAGFPYSPAMRRAGFVWNEKTLDRFLRSPATAVPGTSMGYDGVKDDAERQDLIVFLREVNHTARCHNLPADAAHRP